MQLDVCDHELAICRLDPCAEIPDWASSGFVSITRTPGELSIVCEQNRVPAGTQAVAGWRLLRVAGSMDFSEIGVVASLTIPLAKAGISVFVISTFDTDYLLVRNVDHQCAVLALIQAGHQVDRQD